MAELTTTEPLDFPIDRQSLYNLWSTAVLGTFPKGELQPEVFTMDAGTFISGVTSTPLPGQMFWSEVEGLWYMFHDVIDDTGVSLWLAIGPDRFDVACIAMQPLPAGAVVQPYMDRWVGPSTGASARIWDQRAIGTVVGDLDVSKMDTLAVAFGSTTPSGAWVPVSIDGLVWGYTTGVIDDGRWIRVVDGSFGRCIQNTTGGPQPQHDDSIGMGIFPLAGSTTTPLRFQFIWTGPRVINLL